MAIGLIHPDDGLVFFKGQDATELPITKELSWAWGYLAQELLSPFFDGRRKHPLCFRDIAV
jgi:ABC-type lipopolysaccharide export system ATPase subunit